MSCSTAGPIGAPTPERGAWSAPGRANLIGEHTDHNDGFVLPFPLPWRTTITGRRRDDDRLVVTSGEHPSEGAAYVEGVAWALRQAGHDVGGADLAIDSDVPIGAGLSSSAALCGAAARTLDGLYALGLDDVALVDIAWRAERDFVGVPCGVMDQYASLVGRPGHALFLDCRDRTYRHVPLALAADDLSLLLVDSGVRHSLADGAYASRRADCAAAARALGVPSLRDATPADVGRLDDAVLRRRAAHVVSENQRVLDGVAVLEGGRPRELGPLLDASHRSLRDDFEVSCPELDTIVETAMEAGALGARMIGGGFGGSALVLVDADTLVDVERALAARCKHARPWHVRG